jgi:exodeoxyribonuclease III
MKKIISYNVNGIRAAFGKGFGEWVRVENPDIICIQETKAQPDQIEQTIFNELGYSQIWNSAVKKGYSGVGLLSKQKPDKVIVGMNIEKYDVEGRVIRADFGDVSVISVYIPSGTTGDVRQEVKMQFLADFQKFIDDLKKERPNLIISGDFNICHKPIDIHDPVGNKKSSGFLPEERAWVDSFIASGFVDSFRAFNQEPHQYSWWSYRVNARERNLGWRIDYHMVSKPLENRLRNASILAEINHSDHCPISVSVEF